MQSGGAQLPLLIKLQDQAVFASYFSGPNSETVSQLRRQPDAGGGVIWLWGEAATGKSHLLQAVCSACENSAYLPCTELLNIGHPVLDGFSRYSLLCLDDIDQLIGAGAWEQGIFTLFNELVAEGRGTLVVSSTLAPKTLLFQLADLQSRLLSGPVYRLAGLSDDERLAAIQLRATRRGLELPSATGRFLLKHFRRDMRSLCQMLDKLDTASLVYQSRLTIPLVKSTLQKSNS